jgi:hypothetical protein
MIRTFDAWSPTSSHCPHVFGSGSTPIARQRLCHAVKSFSAPCHKYSPLCNASWYLFHVSGTATTPSIVLPQASIRRLIIIRWGRAEKTFKGVSVSCWWVRVSRRCCRNAFSELKDRSQSSQPKEGACTGEFRRCLSLRYRSDGRKAYS